MTVPTCRIQGYFASMATWALCRFCQSMLCSSSSEACFTDNGCQFLLLLASGLWHIEGNTRVTNLTAVNGHAFAVDRQVFTSGNVIELVSCRGNGKQEGAPCGLDVPAAGDERFVASIIEDT